MKSTRNPFTVTCVRSLLLTGTIAFSFASPSAHAAIRVKADNADNLNLTTSWVGAVLVSSVDVGQWTSTVLAANTTILGADQSWLGISIVSPGGLVTIGAGNTLTLGTSGIAMNTATQDLTFSAGLTLAVGNQNWNVQTDRTLTLNTGTFSRLTGSTLNLPGVGTVSSSLTNLSANTADLVGPWATVGTGTAAQYATFSGSNIVAFSSATPAADGSALTDTSGLSNYNLAASGGTVPPSVSANTIRYTGAVGATAIGATAFSVNGLLNAGTGILTLDSGTLTIGANKELVVNTTGSGIAIASVIQDNGGGESALTKAGGGTLTLSGTNNSYTGITTINSGVLDVGDLANLSLGSGGLLFNADSVLQGSGTFTRNFTATSTMTAAAGQIAGFSGGFAARGGPLVVNFGGLTAPVTLSGVSPRFGNNFILGSSTANNKVTVQNPINLNGSNRTITVNSGLGGDYAEFSGLLSGTGVSGITKSGTGRLVLSALNNTYAGTTTINAGSLDVGLISNNSLGANGLLFAGGVLQGNGSFTRDFSGAATAAANQIAGLTGGFSANGGPLTVNFGGLTAAVTLSGSGTTPKFGNGLIFGSSSADNKVTVVNSVALNGAVRSITVNSGLGGDSAELSGILTGTTAAGIDKKGTGLLTLSNANTYGGNTIVSAGMLAISNANALGATAAGATNTTSITSGASLQLTDGITTDAVEPLTISGTGFTNVGALQAGTGGGTWAGPITLGAIASRVGATPGNTLTITGSIAAGTTTSLSISGGGGTGVVVLNPTSPNTYTGFTLIARGILRLGIADAIPVGSVLDCKNVAGSPDAASFDLAGFNQTLGGLTDLDTAVVNDTITNSLAASTSTLTLNNLGDYTFDGVIQNGVGTVALTKTGAATQTLTGANTYTGATAVSVGTLALVGGSQASPITVATGAFLGFTLGSPTTSTALVDLTLGKVKITGTPAPATIYTLLTTTATISGTPVLDAPIAGYQLVVEGGNVLKLNPVSTNTYSDWLLANSPAAGFVTDSDSDGVSNGVENVLGTNPNVYSAGLTEVSAAASSITFKHTLNPTIASDVSYAYQWSTDLVEWKASGQPNSGTTIVSIVPSAPVSGVVTVTATVNSGPSNKLFLRLNSGQP